MGSFVSDFFGQQVILRQFPCGTEYPTHNLVGILSQAPGLLQDDPDTLYAKYGYGASEWTVVSQVASVASDDSTVERVSDDSILVQGSEVQRQNFETVIDRFMLTVQRLGFSPAPRFPEISVTPLAVYHSVTVE
jgi:hypothetical protein